MAGKIKDCVQAREAITSAASGALSSGAWADFQAHLLHCAACRDEFRRVQMLFRAIDAGVSASVAPGPSPRLVANVRQAIAEHPVREWGWRPRSRWLSAAGVCAVLAICLFAVRTLRNSHGPRNTRNAVNAPSPAGDAVTRTPVAPIELVRSAPARKPGLAALHGSVRTPRDHVAAPEVIIEPGQMQAILRLASAARRGEIEGADPLASEKKATDPFQIEPLTIAPLKIYALGDRSNWLDSDSASRSSENFVSDRSN